MAAWTVSKIVMVFNNGYQMIMSCPVLAVLPWILAPILLWHFVIMRVIRKIHPFPVPAFLTDLIDNPIRRKFIQKPGAIATNMGARPGMVVLEVGPGKGSYTAAVAREVSPGGTVHAIDISERVIARLKDKIARGNLPGNIEPRVDNVYQLSFDDDSIDIVLAVACLPEIPDLVKAMEEFKRVLKPGGVVSTCEVVLDPDYPLRRTEVGWAAAAGLELQSRHGTFFSYQLVFVKR